MLTRTRALAVAVSVGLLLPAGTRAQRFVIDLDDPDFMPYPMAVPDFVDLSGKHEQLATRMANVLRNNLDISEAFSIIPRIAYLAPKSEPWTNPSFPDWVKVGASGLIRAAYTVDDEDGLKITFRLYDVVAQREALVKHYVGKLTEHRRLVHRFSDDLYRFFTGQRSIFGTRIAFVGRSLDAKDTIIYVTDFDGHNIQAVVSNDNLNLLPNWSHDGATLYFTSYLRDNPDLYALNLATRDVRIVSNRRGLNVGVTASRDGTRLAFTLSKDGNTEIYVMNVDGTNLTRLTRFWGEDVSPTWNPDGSRIAFVSSRSGHPQIYTMNSSDGSEVRRLTFQGNYNTEPNWSPRPGGGIVFTARDERNQFDIFVVDPESGEITRLTQDQGNNEGPSFSPDGRHIVFTSTRVGGGRKPFIMNSDGRNQRQLITRRGDFETPAWSPMLPWD